MSDMVKLRNKKTGEIVTLRKKQQEQQPEKRTMSQYLLPQLISGYQPKRGERTLMGDIYERPQAAVREGLRGLAPGGESVVSGFKKGWNFPEESETIQQEFLRVGAPKTESVMLNYLGGLPPSTVGLAADIATDPTTWIMGILSKMKFSNNVKTVVTSVDDVTGKYYHKAVKPSSAGIKSAGGIKKFNKEVSTAVGAIVDNADSLRFTDETGKLVQRLPENLDEMTSAVSTTKKNIFAQYDAMTQKAGQMRKYVNLRSVGDELVESASKSSTEILAPDVHKYALDMAERMKGKKFLTLPEAQDWLELLNKRLKTFYANPTPDDGAKRVFDAFAANKIREQLDAIVSKNVDDSFMALKRQYGALSAIEDDVAKSAFREAKRNAKGLIDFSDIFTVSEIASGLAVFSPGRMIRGGIGFGLKNLYKHLNKPDRSIKVMFKEIMKSKEAATGNLLRDLLRTGATTPASTRALKK